ncbi:MAG: hypothetical protein ACREIA_24530 [Opitutaceae bacterium]
MRKNSVGILPVGALGAGFFHHLTDDSRVVDGAVMFFDRPGSASTRAIHAAGGVRIRDAGGKVRMLPGDGVLGGSLVETLEKTGAPEVIIVSCNPDQLLVIVSHLVEFVCAGHARLGLEQLENWLPTVVLSPNGIYFERVRLIYAEKLEEAMVFKRLPQLWPEFTDRLLGRFLRSVTMQTGVREGAGGAAVYRPGPRGRTRIAGGDAAARARAVEVLTRRGGIFEDAGLERPTRLEFDKGLLNLASNLFGQLLAIDDSGCFTPLTVEEILAPQYRARSLELARHVAEIGRAVGAYGAKDDPALLHARMIEAALVNREHVPSSLQYLGLTLQAGTLVSRLTPTEQWLFEPLIRYARSAGLDEAVAYFRNLRARVIARLELAIARRAREAGQPSEIGPESL